MVSRPRARPYQTDVYAGLASAYILQDAFEQELITLGIIPSDEVPLILQDKSFKSGNPKYAKQYPEWEYPIGDLWYPYLYEGPPVAAQTLPPTGSDSGRWANSKTNGVLSTVPSCVPEAFFDTIMVNGAVYPYMNVQKKRYRFRILNAAQARFFNLQLYIRDGSADGITLRPSGVDNNGNPLLVPTNAAGPAMIQIGNECGFIPIPAVLNNPPKPIGFESSTLPTNGNVNRYTLLMSPAERADVIIDFSALPVGTELLLYNDAPAPFPGGDIRNDYYTGNYDLTHIGGAPATKAGFSPNTRTLMEFRVGAAPSLAAAVPDFQTQITQLTNALPTAPYAGSHPPNVSTSGLPIRRLTLNEGEDDLGRLLQLLGTDVRLRGNNYGRALSDPPTETPEAGSIEVWKVFNYTADTHPIHIHLVNVAVISRQTFDTTQPPTDKALIGQPRLPDLNELGYKETIRMNPGEVTTLLMKFDLPPTPFTVPLSRRTNVAGYEYVWHCHILEHEEHDMMRPLIVTP